MGINSSAQKYISILLLLMVLAVFALPLPALAQQSSGSSNAATVGVIAGTIVAAGVVGLALCQTSGISILGFKIGGVQCSITNPGGVHLLSSDGLKKWIFEPAARMIIRAVLQATTQQIVSWIQGNSGKNVGYVKNLDEALRREADIAGGEFLNTLTGLNLCGNINAFLQITLRTPGLQQRLTCSVTDIVRNVNSFYQNFQNGGWPAFIRVSLEPQNNPYGAYLIALEAKGEAESRARQRVSEGYRVGQGFEGFKVPVKRNCQILSRPSYAPGQGGEGSIGYAIPVEQQLASLGNSGFAAIGLRLAETSLDEQERAAEERIRVEQLQREQNAQEQSRQLQSPEQVEQTGAQVEEIRQITEPEQIGGQSSRAQEQVDRSSRENYTACETQYETKTPGSLIAATLSKATGNGIDFANTAKDFDEAIAVVINALLNKLITATFATGDGQSGGEGLFDPGLSQIYLPPEENGGIFITQIYDLLTTTNATLVAIDGLLKDAYVSLFAARRRIVVTQEEMDKQKEDTTLQQTKIDLILKNKTKIIALKANMVALKNAITFSTDPKEVSKLAFQIPQLNSQLFQASNELGINVLTEPSSRDTRKDNLRFFQGTADAAQSMLGVIDVVIDEANLIASTTPSASLKASAEAQRDNLSAEARSIKTAKARLENSMIELNRAASETEFKRIINTATTLVFDIDNAIQRAGETVRVAGQALKL